MDQPDFLSRILQDHLAGRKPPLRFAEAWTVEKAFPASGNLCELFMGEVLSTDGSRKPSEPPEWLNREAEDLPDDEYPRVLSQYSRSGAEPLGPEWGEQNLLRRASGKVTYRKYRLVAFGIDYALVLVSRNGVALHTVWELPQENPPPSPAAVVFFRPDTWHDGGTILGTAEGLRGLRKAITQALRQGMGTAVLHPGDGESGDYTVARVPDMGMLDAAENPYALGSAANPVVETDFEISEEVARRIRDRRELPLSAREVVLWIQCLAGVGGDPGETGG